MSAIDFINKAKYVFDDNYDNEEILNILECRAIAIIRYMGPENAKKLNKEQIKDMMMANPHLYNSFDKERLKGL